MEKNTIFQTKLTVLQENILLEFNKTTNFSFICKKLNIKPITLTKAFSALIDKKLIYENKLTEKGKKMVHYLEFKNETISSFLQKYKINTTPEINNQMNQLDHTIIIALKNLL